MASGVTECFSGLADNNTIRRTISLTGGNLHGDEQVTLRLRLPEGNAAAANRALFVTHGGCPQALVVSGDELLKVETAKGMIEIGPITLSPDKTATIETYLLAQIPAKTGAAKDFQEQPATGKGFAPPRKRSTVISSRWPSIGWHPKSIAASTCAVTTLSNSVLLRLQGNRLEAPPGVATGNINDLPPP